mmetsp:Transcript_20181/g.36564  ORF Transcript_20181/g.36564 Transcript_20181/m.36564 type:complete len:260 (-) Transcript_20181:143-922(-)
MLSASDLLSSSDSTSNLVTVMASLGGNFSVGTGSTSSQSTSSICSGGTSCTAISIPATATGLPARGAGLTSCTSSSFASGVALLGVSSASVAATIQGWLLAEITLVASCPDASGSSIPLASSLGVAIGWGAALTRDAFSKECCSTTTTSSNGSGAAGAGLSSGSSILWMACEPASDKLTSEASEMLAWRPNSSSKCCRLGAPVACTTAGVGGSVLGWKSAVVALSASRIFEAVIKLGSSPLDALLASNMLGSALPVALL